MNPELIEALFESIRGSCPRGLWSRGVALSRTGDISSEKIDRDEIRLRIPTLGRLVSPIVSLFPDDEDWTCECPSREDVCEHVVAAILILRRTLESGEEIGASEEVAGLVAYRLEVVSGRFSLRRVIVKGGNEEELGTSLAAIARGRVDGPSSVARNHDMEIEQELGSWRQGLLPRGLLGRLLPHLERAPDMTLDGKTIQVNSEALSPQLVVDDHGSGFRISLEEHPEISRRLPEHFVLCAGELRPTAESGLTARQREDFSRGQTYPADRAADLVMRVLPAIQGRVPIEIRTVRLPRTSRQQARILVETRREGELLSVLASIVYGDPPSARVDGERLVHLGGEVPIRDPEAERTIHRQLARLGLAPGRRAEFAAEDAVTFVRKLEQLPALRRGEGLESFFLAPPVEPRMALDPDTGHCEIYFEAVPGGDDGIPGRRKRGRADAAAVLSAWSQGHSLVPLLDGGWAPFPAAWLERHGQRVLDILESRDTEGCIAKACGLELAQLAEELGESPPAAAGPLRVLAEGFAEIPEAALPPGLEATLRPYQQQGVNWLVFLKSSGLGGLLADDMGLGKTLQTLCALKGRTLVVAPTSVLHNWANEIRRFRPKLRSAVYHGLKRELDPAAEVTLTTYAILRLDEDALSAVNWDTVVLDEAQAIKNPDSQVARAAGKLQAEFRLCLTGTPVENRLEELWSHLHFANPGLLGSRRSFDERYVRPIAAGEEGAAEHLRRRIRPFILRRLKKDVAPELPPRTDTEIYCVLSSGEREIYDAIRAATRSEIVERLRSGQGVIAALEALLRLRQAACHTALIPGQEAAGSSKTTVLVDRLLQIIADGHRALVFSQWTSMLDLIEPHLRAEKIEFLRLDGSTRDRAGVVSGFQDEDSASRVLLISLKAGGTGLNLTAADHVFLVDPWWNPAVEDQAADRTHRIGQDRPVFVHRLVAEDTVEEKILELQNRKRALSDAVLGGAERAASLTREDLLALLD